MERRLPLLVRIMSTFFKTIQILFWTFVILVILLVGIFGCAPGFVRANLEESIAKGHNDNLQSQIDTLKFFDPKPDSDPHNSLAAFAANCNNLEALKKLDQNGFFLGYAPSTGVSAISGAVEHRNYEMYSLIMHRTYASWVDKDYLREYLQDIFKGYEVSPAERRKFLALTWPLQKGTK